MRKGKRKETNKKTQTSDRKPNKGKQQDHLKEESLGTLRQGQRLDTTETKASSSKEYKPPKQSSKTHKSSLAHMHAPPEPMQLPLKNACQPLHETELLHQLISNRSDHNTSQTGAQHLRRANSLTGRIGDHAGQTGSQPVASRARKWLKTT
jgi:hypothetical protein